jgi:hypothetical protein
VTEEEMEAPRTTLLVVEKIMRIRSYCFREGVLKGQPGFQEAFRDLNRLYVEAKMALGGHQAFAGARKFRSRRK